MKNTAGKCVIKDYLIIVAGMTAGSVGIYFFLIPSGIIMGSITGLAMILVKILPTSLSMMTLILNVVCLIVGFVVLGKEFGTKTVLASVLAPVFLYIFEEVFPNHSSFTGEIMLDGLIAILIIGAGQALLFCVNASSGGMDILAKVLNKYTHLELGKAVAVIGMVIVGSSVLVYDIRTVIIGLFFTYCSGLVVNEFLNGFSRKKRVCIISEKSKELKDYILYEINRGVTVYDVVGAYQNKSRKELVTILNQNEYVLLMQRIYEVEERAFVTVSSVSEVAGSWNGKG